MYSYKERSFIPNESFMKLAIAHAEAAALQDEIPVGAVVVREGRILGIGQNRRESSRDALMHAEMEAIKAACSTLRDWRLQDCELYVTLEPCPMCMGAVLNARIQRVIFGADDFNAGCCGSALSFEGLQAYRQPEIFPGFMEQECRQLLSAFFCRIRGTASHAKAVGHSTTAREF